MIHIDIFGDIACPWCYIGEVRLERAIAQRPTFDVVRRWQPFQLQPNLPKGQEWHTFASAKFGGWERALQSFEVVRQAAADTNIQFRLEDIASAANTMDAHRLILYARKHGKEWDMVHTLFKAFFTSVEDLNDRGQLIKIAASTGLERDMVSDLLDSKQLADEVVSSQQRAYSLGIRGVPFYVINDQYGISGAQPPDVFVKALDRVATSPSETSTSSNAP